MNALIAENKINYETGMHETHWMASKQTDLPNMDGERWRGQVGMWHLKVSRPAAGMTRIKLGPFRTAVELRYLDGKWHGKHGALSIDVPGYLMTVDERLRDAIARAAEAYRNATGAEADLLFVRKIPSGAVNLMEIGDAILIQAAWMPHRCLLATRVEDIVG